MIINTDAIVLKTFSYGETSLISRCFTKDKGKISFIIKGAKSKKNLIDIFSNSEIFKDERPYSVHRLDKETSGVFLIAKNRPTAQLLTTLFRLRKVYKTYIAICHGEITIKDKGLSLIHI